LRSRLRHSSRHRTPCTAHGRAHNAPMIRPRALLPLAALLCVLSGGCNRCENSRRDAVAAWNDVVDHALTEAAMWGRTVVSELNKGRYGVPELAEKQRDQWRAVYEKTLAARGMVESGSGWTEELRKIHDELSAAEPEQTKAEWQQKLKAAKDASYLVNTMCRTK
jgi:hypothetical protein